MTEERPLEELVESAVYGELNLPGWEKAFEQLIARINLVHIASPEIGLPPMDEAGRREFFRHAFQKCPQLDEFELIPALDAFVGAGRLQWLDEIVPCHWKVGEHSIPLEYSHETDPGEGVAFAPTARVEAGQLAGVDYHPFVCEGRVAVRIELIDRRGRRLDETFDWPAYQARA